MPLDDASVGQAILPAGRLSSRPGRLKGGLRRAHFALTTVVFFKGVLMALRATKVAEAR
jgi:hypothetical protein